MSSSQQGVGAGRFLWDDYSDLFAKAERDMASLRKALNRDAVFNFLCTVNHVYDWIRNDPRVKGPLPQAVLEADDIKQNDSYVSAVRELCNGVKHLDLLQQPRSIRHAPRHWFERPFASVRLSRHMPLNEGETKYLLDINGTERDMLDVAEEALTRWRGFLGKHGLPVPP